MKKKILCPSMMCADFSMLKDEVAALQAAKIDIFHLDVMDGRFVPNFGMGLQDIEAICKWSETLVDVHLMIEDPGAYVEKFADMGVDIIYFHPPSYKNYQQNQAKGKTSRNRHQSWNKCSNDRRTAAIDRLRDGNDC